ncbi:MAG: hypothetical protein ABEJ70_00790 [Halobacteriaceae archaeon]
MVAVRVADDERARVPFAVVGALLLVTSAGYATHLAGRDPVSPPSQTARAVAAATATARTTLSDAVARAGRAAARHPLTAIDRNGSAYARALNGSRPFRSYYRLRVYLAARDAFRRSGARVGDVTATLCLPRLRTARAVRRAVDRVDVEARGPRNVTVRLTGVPVVVRRDGRVVERRTVSPTVTVETPVLALHRRTAAFQRALERNVTHPGLARRLAVRLNALAWSRGYAQYAGAPVVNVVDNGHVTTATNGALLATERATLGRPDPRARSALVGAVARHLGSTLLGAGTAARDRFDAPARSVRPSRPPGTPSMASRARSLERANRTVSVGAGGSADRAFVDYVRGRGNRSLVDTLREVYEVDARLLVRTRTVDVQVTRPDAPDGWHLGDVHTDTDYDVGPGDVAGPAPPPGYHALRTFGRTVRRVERTRRTYTRGNHTTTATTVRRETVRVGVTVAGAHARTPTAPARGVDGAHRVGGPLDGRNFANVTPVVVGRLVGRRGGTDAVARAAVAGTLDAPANATVPVDPPDGARRFLYAAVARLRDRVRNATVDVPRGAVHDRTPAARLASRFDRRRASLVGVPDRYSSVAAKARVAARGAYLSAVRDRLAARSRADRRAGDAVDTALSWAGVDPGGFDVRSLLATGRPRPAVGPVTGVRTDPAYLPVDASRRRFGARNRDYFAAPYGDAADAVAGDLLPGGNGSASLHDAARVLRAANRTIARAPNATLRHRRDRLRRAVGEGMDRVRSRLTRSLARTTDLPPRRRRSLVRAALARYETTDARALAAANGSLATAVGGELTARTDVDGVDRDWSLVRLRAALRRVRAAPSTRPSAATLEAVGNATRAAGRRLVRRAVRRGLERAGERVRTRVQRRLATSLAPVPAGLPITPVPAYWYATVNVWRVDVHGSYRQVAVTAPAHAPGRGAAVTYRRRDEAVSVDVDDDGEAERLGRNERVAFDATVPVLVAVPPGGDGVGDHGEADEQTPGWK